MTVVLLDPDDYLKDDQYIAERRAGRAPLKNLRAFASDGRLLWSAEFPDEPDYYAEVESTSPLVALSYSGFRCTIDQRDGSIVEQQFLK